MKRILFVIVLCLAICSTASAAKRSVIQNGENVEVTNVSSVVITDDALIKTGDGTLYGVLVAADGSTSGDIIDLFDDVTFSGATKVMSIVLGGTDELEGFSIPNGIGLDTGLYADVTLNGDVRVTVVYK